MMKADRKVTCCNHEIGIDEITDNLTLNVPMEMASEVQVTKACKTVTPIFCWSIANPIKLNPSEAGKRIRPRLRSEIDIHA